MKPEGIEIGDKEKQILDEILEEYKIEENEEGISIKYKLKNTEELQNDYELNPHIAAKEFHRLNEQPKILNESILIMLLVKYEEAIRGLFKDILLKFPVAYLESKTITYADLMKLQTDISIIKNKFIEMEVDEIMRQPISNWFEMLSSKHKIKFLWENNIFDKFKEIYYRRNLIVHNEGIVNQVYLINVSENYTKDIHEGEELRTDEKYINNAFTITQLVLYEMFWELRKISQDKMEVQECLFLMGFEHMIKGEWVLSKFIYNLLVEEKTKMKRIDYVAKLIIGFQLKIWKG